MIFIKKELMKLSKALFCFLLGIFEVETIVFQKDGYYKLNLIKYMKLKDITVLIIVIILFFLAGLIYDVQYRTLTRTIVYKLANYNLEFYGAKQFRFFVPDLGFILTLIPIGLCLILKFQNFNKSTFIAILILPFLLILFYLFFCFSESQIIKYTTVIDSNNIYNYHHSNVNYRLIAIFSIVSSLIIEYLFLKIIKKNIII